jgi:hypothetical protein
METTMENQIAPDPTVDLNQIKSMLELPATASDIELITVLVNLVANLQEKYEGLLADAVAMEDKLVNRDLADFDDVIDEHSQPFWKEQVLLNRSVALEALGALRTRMADQVPPAPPVIETRTIPLRNRLSAINRSVETIVQGEPVANRVSAEESMAVRIRNRAHDIVRGDGVPFLIAFSRAEKEINKE